MLLLSAGSEVDADAVLPLSSVALLVESAAPASPSIVVADAVIVAPSVADVVSVPTIVAPLLVEMAELSPAVLISLLAISAASALVSTD